MKTGEDPLSVRKTSFDRGPLRWTSLKPRTLQTAPEFVGIGPQICWLLLVSLQMPSKRFFSQGNQENLENLLQVGGYFKGFPLPRVHLEKTSRRSRPQKIRAAEVQIFHGLNVVQKNFPWHPSTGPWDSFTVPFFSPGEWQGSERLNHISRGRLKWTKPWGGGGVLVARGSGALKACDAERGKRNTTGALV